MDCNHFFTPPTKHRQPSMMLSLLRITPRHALRATGTAAKRGLSTTPNKEPFFGSASSSTNYAKLYEDHQPLPTTLSKVLLAVSNSHLKAVPRLSSFSSSCRYPCEAARAVPNHMHNHHLAACTRHGRGQARFDRRRSDTAQLGARFTARGDAQMLSSAHKLLPLLSSIPTS